MTPGQYRLITSILSLFQRDGRHVANVVPKDSVITIPTGTVFNGNKLIEVLFDGRLVMMFTKDVREGVVPLAVVS